MKQYIKYLAAASFLALFACSGIEQESPVWTSYISFGTPTLEVSTTAMTKGGIYDGRTLPDGSSFGVMAYCYSSNAITGKLDAQSKSSLWDTKWAYIISDGQSSKNTGSGLFKQEVQYENGSCSYPKDSYETWIDAGYYSFLAYYPYGSFTFNRPEKGPVSLTYSIPSNKDYNSTEDVMVSFLKDRSEADGSVKFQFRHLLTALAIEVNNLTADNDSSMSEEDRKLTVHSIKLNGQIYKSVSYDFKSADPSVTVGTETIAAAYSLNTPAEVLPSGATFKTDYILLCPGIAPEVNKLNIEINYTFKGEAKSFTANMNESFEARSGWKYKLSLNFVGNVFTVKVVADGDEHWEGGNSEAGDVIFM